MTNIKSLFTIFKKNIVKKVVLILLILLVAWFAKGLVLAVLVNGYPVSRFSVIKALEKQGGSSVLESLIDRSLVTQEAKRQKVVISQETVDVEIKRIEKLLSDQGVTLDEALAMQGQKRADFEEEIKVQKTVESILSQRINISDGDLEAYYKENKDVLYKDKSLEDVKEEIRQSVYQQRLQEEYQKWIQDLRAKAKIIYLVDYQK